MAHIHSDTDLRTIKGRTYHRGKDEPFYLAEDDDVIPAIVCECGSDTFRLTYGHWSLRAHCAECHKSASVYSG